MVTPKSQLLAILERFENISITVIGDLILDHYIWGRVDRISPEAPVVVVQVTEESRRPGGAGNVVSNLSALGACASVCGYVGDDEAGREMCLLLSSLGANIEGVAVDSGRPTTVKTRVIAHAQQVVRVDREVISPLSAESMSRMNAMVSAALPGSRGVIVSDYAKGAITPQLFAQLEQRPLQAGSQQRVPLVVDPKAPNFNLYRNATVIKPNRREAESASGEAIRRRADAVKAGKILLERWDCETVMITLGENGMVLVSRNSVPGQEIEIETVAREVYDVSGAGDTVSAVFTLALAAGATLRAAAELANFAAGVVVAEIGTVAVTKQQLVDAIENH